MKIFKFLISIFLIFTFIKVLDAKFTSTICNHDQPHIHFPFKVNSFCEHNHTMIIFEGYGKLQVKSISYDHKKLSLIDPKDCVFEVFLNLDLDSTPFRYYHVVKNYTYWNCLKNLEGFEEVPCLSDAKHHVYVVESSLDVASSCELVKNVAIPFAYNSYVSDDSFGLDLSWDLDGVEDLLEEKRGFGFRTGRQELSIAILVLVVVGLACLKICCWKKLGSNEHSNEWERLLGDLETL